MPNHRRNAEVASRRTARKAQPHVWPSRHGSAGGDPVEESSRAGVPGATESWHALVVLDTAAHFCLTVFDLCRQIRLLGVSAVSETTAAYLFGSAPSFRARRDLYGRVHKLLSTTGVLSPGGPTLPPLEPSYTAHLAELAVHFINRPHAAVLIPQIVQDMFWRVLGAVGAQPRDNTNFLAAEKLTQDLLDFLKTATGATWVPRV